MKAIKESESFCQRLRESQSDGTGEWMSALAKADGWRRIPQDPRTGTGMAPGSYPQLMGDGSIVFRLADPIPETPCNVDLRTACAVGPGGFLVSGGGA